MYMDGGLNYSPGLPLIIPNLIKTKQEPEEDENADDTGDYMPPLLQGHRVTLEGKLTTFLKNKKLIQEVP